MSPAALSRADGTGLCRPDVEQVDPAVVGAGDEQVRGGEGQASDRRRVGCSSISAETRRQGEMKEGDGPGKVWMSWWVCPSRRHTCPESDPLASNLPS